MSSDNATPRDTEQRQIEERLYRLSVLDHLFSRAKATETPRYSERSALVDRLWSNAPFAAERPADPVPELSGDEALFERFIAASRRYRRPVVLRGFGASIAACRNWSAESLRARIGEMPCTVVEMDAEAMREAHASRRVLLEMSFREFIERMNTEPLYLHNSTEFAAHFPELEEELGLDRIREALTAPDSRWDELFSTNLFVGSEKVFSNLHCAPGGNFFLQIAGKKTWTLIDPDYSPYLFPILSRPFNHCLSAFGSFKKYRDRGEQAPIAGLPRYTVVLEPGDLLYNPPWWWHEVENEGETIGCAIRHVPSPLAPSPTWKNHRLFSALSIYPQLWLYSAWNYARHRITGRTTSMRSMLNRRLAQQLNRARGR